MWSLDTVAYFYQIDYYAFVFKNCNESISGGISIYVKSPY